MIIFLGILSVILQFGDYALYFRGIFKHNTKPHFFTWLIWSISIWTVFFIQVVNGAGAGSWTTGVSGILAVGVMGIAFYQRKIIYTKWDWLSLFGALFALFLWLVVEAPLSSILLILLVDTMGYIPTIRKSFYDPFSEPILAWSVSSIKYIPALLVMESFTLVTTLYPIMLIILNVSVFMLLFIRQKQLQTHSQ